MNRIPLFEAILQVFYFGMTQTHDFDVVWGVGGVRISLVDFLWGGGGVVRWVWEVLCTKAPPLCLNTYSNSDSTHHL